MGYNSISGTLHLQQADQKMTTSRILSTWIITKFPSKPKMKMKNGKAKQKKEKKTLI